MAITLDGTNGVTTPSLTADTTTLVVDETNNRVGIGTDIPTKPLHIYGNTSNNHQIRLQNDFGSGADWTLNAYGANGNLYIGNNLDRLVVDSTGNLQFNSGYGSVATAYGCRAWVQFNGTGSVAIRGSGNVTSVTDQGVGKYDVNYTTSIVDDTYSCQVTKKNEAANSGFVIQVPDLLTTRTRVECFENNTLTDSGRVSVAVFR